MNLLIVEDDKDVQEFYNSEFTEHFDCKITQAYHGAQGFSLAATELFDLIISDFNMPIQNGLWLLTQLRETNNPNNGTTVLFVSGFTKDFIGGAEIFDNVFFKDKPVEMKPLLNMIRLCTKQKFKEVS